MQYILWNFQQELPDLQLEKYIPRFIRLLTLLTDDDFGTFHILRQLLQTLQVDALQAKEAVPKLIDLYLNNTSLESTESSHLIIQTLRDLPATEQTIPKFIELLAYGDTRLLAIQKLQSLNANQTIQVKQKIPEIIKLLSDAKPNVRLTAIAALQAFRVKEAVPNLFKLLHDNDPNVISTAIIALLDLQGKEIIPEIIEQLHNTDFQTRKTLIKTLRNLKFNSSNDQNKDVEILTTTISAFCDLLVKEDISKFIKLLDEQDQEIRLEAIAELQRVQAKEAIPKLIEHLDDSDPLVRYNVIEILHALQAKEVIPKLIGQLDNIPPDIRYEIIRELQTLKNKETIPKLIEQLDDTDPQVRYNVTQVLQELQAKEAIPALIKHLDDSDMKVKIAVINTLQELQAKEAISKLIEVLPSSDAELNTAVITALQKLQAKEAVPKLIEISIHPKANEHCTAINTLQALQTKEVFLKDTFPQIIQRSDIKKLAECPEVITALLTLPTEQAIPKLVEVLAQPLNRDITITVIKTLKNLQARQAIPALIEVAVKYYENNPEHKTVAEPQNYYVSDSDVYDAAIEALQNLRITQPIHDNFRILEQLTRENKNPYKLIGVLKDLQIKYMIPEIIELLTNHDKNVRRAALLTLKDLHVEEK